MAADPAAAFVERIHAIAPALVVETARFVGEGLANEVVIVNDRLVFRFARGAGQPDALAGELAVLRAVAAAPGAGRLPVPRPFYSNDGVMAYELVRGRPLAPWALQKLDDGAQQALADELAGFLRALHGAAAGAGPLPPTRAFSNAADWAELRASAEALLYPIWMDHQTDWLRERFAQMLDDPRRLAYAPALIHGDLWPEHILFDPATGRLSGMIDFGMAGLGDPATDLGNLLQVYGDRFTRRLFGRYPEAAGLMERARFYAEMHEVWWTVRGLSSGATFWFTGHLGNARA